MYNWKSTRMLSHAHHAAHMSVCAFVSLHMFNSVHAVPLLDSVITDPGRLLPTNLWSYLLMAVLCALIFHMTFVPWAFDALLSLCHSSLFTSMLLRFLPPLSMLSMTRAHKCYFLFWWCYAGHFLWGTSWGSPPADLRGWLGLAEANWRAEQPAWRELQWGNNLDTALRQKINKWIKMKTEKNYSVE